MQPRSAPVAALALLLLLVPTVQAHSVLTAGDNESLATAMVVQDPTKSWAVYAELHEGGEAQYYTFDIAEGQTILVQLFVSTSAEDATFTPGFAIMGPGLTDRGAVPAYVERPNGTGVVAQDGVWPAQATYEAFAPSSFYDLGRITMSAPATGTYYVAVYEPTRGGRYGLAIGERESFTLAEWVLTPLSVLSVHEWEGQSLAVVLAPAIATIVAGLALLWWRRRDALTPRSWLAALAGLLFLGSGATVLTQMAVSMSRAPAGAEASITMIFALIPILIGLMTLRAALARAAWDRRRRITLAVLGIVAVFGWAGFLVGPALAVAAGVMPTLSSSRPDAMPQP